MNNLWFYTYTFFAVVLLANCQSDPNQRSVGPNFLIILADDLDYSDLGAYGSEIPTPNIDLLAQAGMQFTNFFAASNDDETRAMLLTGTTQGQIPGAIELQDAVVSLSQILQEAGYKTCFSGKWNLGKMSPDLPVDKGFEHSFALMDEKSNHLGSKRYLPAVFRENHNIKEISEDFYSTQYFSRKLLSFLSTGRKSVGIRPFFALLAFTAPHYPLQASESTIRNFRNQYDEGYEVVFQKRLARQRELGLTHGGEPIGLMDWNNLPDSLQDYEARKMEIYAAMVKDMDKHIGRIVDFLKISGQYQNTIIFFLSDGGITTQKDSKLFSDIDNHLANLGKANSMVSLGEGWEQIKMGPRSRPPKELFEGMIKVPLIISSPLLKKTDGIIKEDFGSILDLMPSVLDLAGITHPSEGYFSEALPMEGVSLELETVSTTKQ